MKGFISVFQASFWFALCVGVAIILLAVAITYKSYIALKKGKDLKKIEFLRIQITR